jgi:hypothetical protein
MRIAAAFLVAVTACSPDRASTPPAEVRSETVTPSGDTSSAGSTSSTEPPPYAGVTAIAVDSRADQYFVLYVKPDLASGVEIPVAVFRGQPGKTILTDGRSALLREHYRVATFDVGKPGDVDGDSLDDLTEFSDPVGANPLNPAAPIDPKFGTVIIPDVATFARLSYTGDLASTEFVKFWILNADTAHPSVYFVNTAALPAHRMFAAAVGLDSRPSPGTMRGDIVYLPDATAPNGSKGYYRMDFQPNDAYSFREVALAYEMVSSSMAFLADNLYYYPSPQAGAPRYLREKALYDAYRVPVLVG